MMVDASGDWGPSDPGTLHQAIFEMRRRGHADDVVEGDLLRQSLPLPRPVPQVSGTSPAPGHEHARPAALVPVAAPAELAVGAGRSLGGPRPGLGLRRGGRRRAGSDSGGPGLALPLCGGAAPQRSARRELRPRAPVRSGRCRRDGSRGSPPRGPCASLTGLALLLAVPLGARAVARGAGAGGVGLRLQPASEEAPAGRIGLHGALPGMQSSGGRGDGGLRGRSGAGGARGDGLHRRRDLDGGSRERDAEARPRGARSWLLLRRRRGAGDPAGGSLRAAGAMAARSGLPGLGGAVRPSPRRVPARASRSSGPDCSRPSAASSAT